MLIELHSLTSHAPSNLNRDDLGRPKAAIFGGVQRARISSQAIKRSVRTSNYLAGMLADRLSTRSRRIPEKLIYEELSREINGDATLDERLRKLCGTFTEVIGKPDKNPLHTKQIVFMTKDEIERAKNYVRGLLRNDSKLTKNLDEIKANAAKDIGLNKVPGDGVDMALFGRMTTGDANSFAPVDAAMQVAHAISTHEVVPDVDWFTAVDDIVTGETETGSGHLGELEFNAAVFYKYFSCNMPQLIGNLNDDRSAAVDALTATLDAACRVTPSGKQNSFASHSLADTVLLVIRRERIPVSLANAFERPVVSGKDGYLSESRRRLAEHYRDIQCGYGLGDKAICYTISAGEREVLRELLPADVLIVSSLSELFDAMKRHAHGDVAVEGAA